MRIALALVAVLVVAGCGGHKAAQTTTTSTTTGFVAVPVPLFPGADSPKVVTNPTYQTTDFTLPAGTKPTTVYDWYTSNLASRGWKITQRNETGVHAEKGGRSLDVGVRGTTLEINQG